MNIDPRSGQSLMELLVGIAIAGIFVIGATTIVIPSLRVSTQAANMQEEAELGQEMIGNVRSWANGNWSGVLASATGTANKYYLHTATSSFAIAATSTSGESISSCVSSVCTSYTRYFYFSDVYRDSSGNATSSGSGTYYDPSTKMVTVIVGSASTTAPSLAYNFYMTRNADNVFTQGTWAGGSGQAGPLTFVSSTYFAATNVSVNATGSLLLTASGTGYPVSGTLTSVTFDTKTASGSQLNAVAWSGSATNGAQVGFQLAASNVSSGPWTFEGPSGDGTTYFGLGSAPNTSIPLLSNLGGAGYGMFSGYRYFRYQIALFSDGTQTYTPLVTGVSVNWSP